MAIAILAPESVKYGPLYCNIPTVASCYGPASLSSRPRRSPRRWWPPGLVAPPATCATSIKRCAPLAGQWEDDVLPSLRNRRPRRSTGHRVQCLHRPLAPFALGFGKPAVGICPIAHLPGTHRRPAPLAMGADGDSPGLVGSSRLHHLGTFVMWRWPSSLVIAPSWMQIGPARG